MNIDDAPDFLYAPTVIGSYHEIGARKFDTKIDSYKTIWDIDTLYEKLEDPNIGPRLKREYKRQIKELEEKLIEQEKPTFALKLIPLSFNFEEIGPKHTAIIGSSGNGKSIVAYDLVEEAFYFHHNVIVLDPTGQWTGFVAPCKDRKLTSKYRMFAMKDEPHGYQVDIFTPNSNVGLELKINLLAKPNTDDDSELMAETRDVVQFLKEYCSLSSKEETDVKETIFNSWKMGKSLDHKSLVDSVKLNETKKGLQDLIALKILFDENPNFDIDELSDRSIISLKYLKTPETFNLVSYCILRKIIEYYDAQPDATQGRHLDLLLVIEEASRFDNPLVKKMIDRIARTLRKKGVGLLIITQRFVDLGNVQTNINTKIYMRTSYQADLDRASIDLGDMHKLLPSMATGSGIFFSPDVGEPKIVKFRPCFHRNTELSDDEIRESKKNNFDPTLFK